MVLSVCVGCVAIGDKCYQPSDMAYRCDQCGFDICVTCYQHDAMPHDGYGDGYINNNISGDGDDTKSSSTLPHLSSQLPAPASTASAAGAAVQSSGPGLGAVMAATGASDRVVKLNIAAIIQTLKHLRGADRTSKGLTGLKFHLSGGRPLLHSLLITANHQHHDGTHHTPHKHTHHIT